MMTPYATEEQLMGQMTLPYQKHSQTSKDTAKKEANRQNSFKWTVLDHFDMMRTCGITDEELTSYLSHCQPSTVRARRIGLVKQGFLMDSKTTRPTKSGNKATVWIRTEKRR